MELVNRVRAILDERNISQASFARKIDVSPQVLSGWMMGRRTPGIAELAAMAEELHVSPSYLLTGRDDDPNRQSLVDDDGVCIPLLDVHASCGNGVQLATTTVVKMIKVNHQWINRYCGTASPKGLVFFARLQHLRVFPISARFTFLPLLRILFTNDRTAMRLLVNSPPLPELRTVKNGHRWEGHRISALSCVGDRLRSGCAVG